MRKLIVHLDGADPAITEHRLSLEQLAGFARLLINAYRRAAQEILTGNKAGNSRFPERAKELHLELVAFEQGSVQLAIAPRDTSSQEHLLLSEPLDELALGTLSRAIGEARDARAQVNPAVRKLLRFFGGGIRQRYAFLRDGLVENSYEFSSEEIPELVDDRPRTLIQHRVGRVRGALVEPPTVFFVAFGETTPRRVEATPELVEKAWALRDCPDVVATVVVSSKADRLVAVRARAEFGEWRDADRNITSADIAAKWASALEALAQYDRN